MLESLDIHHGFNGERPVEGSTIYKLHVYERISNRMTHVKTLSLTLNLRPLVLQLHHAARFAVPTEESSARELPPCPRSRISVTSDRLYLEHKKIYRLRTKKINK